MIAVRDNDNVKNLKGMARTEVNVKLYHYVQGKKRKFDFHSQLFAQRQRVNMVRIIDQQHFPQGNVQYNINHQWVIDNIVEIQKQQHLLLHQQNLLIQLQQDHHHHHHQQQQTGIVMQNASEQEQQQQPEFGSQVESIMGEELDQQQQSEFVLENTSMEDASMLVGQQHQQNYEEAEIVDDPGHQPNYYPIQDNLQCWSSDSESSSSDSSDSSGVSSMNESSDEENKDDFCVIIFEKIDNDIEITCEIVNLE